MKLHSGELTNKQSRKTIQRSHTNAANVTMLPPGLMNYGNISGYTVEKNLTNVPSAATHPLRI